MQNSIKAAILRAYRFIRLFEWQHIDPKIVHISLARESQSIEFYSACGGISVLIFHYDKRIIILTLYLQIRMLIGCEQIALEFPTPMNKQYWFR